MTLGEAKGIAKDFLDKKNPDRLIDGLYLVDNVKHVKFDTTMYIRKLSERYTLYLVFSLDDGWHTVAELDDNTTNDWWKSTCFDVSHIGRVAQTIKRLCDKHMGKEA